MPAALDVHSGIEASPEPTRLAQPIILVRGFGGLRVDDEKKIAYQGFNDGTVYPQKRGENYIYEGLILRFMKWLTWSYHDATNIVGYYNRPVARNPGNIADELKDFDPNLFFGHKVVIDPGMALNLVRSEAIDACRTLWVFRYYDLDDRDDFTKYGEALVRLIDFIQQLAELKERRKNEKRGTPKVNIIAHSMGGLIVREAVQRTYPKGEAAKHINKIVTLGTPHQGISFQILQDWIGIAAAEELEQFNPKRQASEFNPVGFKNFARHFPPERVLTVVGTNYRTFGPVVASWLNRAFSVAGEFGANYNRSDGLVKQAYAEIPGTPRTFIHKCHAGPDSLVTSREAFEIATRFFFGNIKVRLHLLDAKITRGGDWFGKSEFFFGVSIKPRKVDFDLFHQSTEAENCYGPFSEADLSDPEPAFGWAGNADGKRLIWEGWLDTTASDTDDIVLRLDIYVGERDLYGIGFSDNVIFRQQYYVRAVFDDIKALDLRELILHDTEDFSDKDRSARMDQPDGSDKSRWEFKIAGTGFAARFGVDLAVVPEHG
jgi:hypothetical protein